MKQLLLALLLCCVYTSIAQNNTIAPGEKLVFSASYNMSGLLTDLAQVTMETSEVNTSSSTLMRLKCTARTYKKWDNFFKINDLYESYVNPRTLTPYLYKREINEGGHYKYVKYNFDYKDRRVKSLRRQKSKNFESGYWDRKANIPFSYGAKDLVSTIYHIRNLDIHKAPKGSSDTFTVLFDNVETKVRVTMLGKESIDTKLGRKDCYKLSISIANNDVLKGSNTNVLWLTADKNKIPVYAKFKVAIGNGELKIQSATGLKY